MASPTIVKIGSHKFEINIDEIKIRGHRFKIKMIEMRIKNFTNYCENEKLQI